MANNAVKIGLRLLEFECGITTNIDDSHSAELVDYERFNYLYSERALQSLAKGFANLKRQGVKRAYAVSLSLLLLATKDRGYCRSHNVTPFTPSLV
jgi:hypothetical protein